MVSDSMKAKESSNVPLILPSASGCRVGGRRYSGSASSSPPELPLAPLHPQPPARASSSPPWLQLQHLRQPPERHFQPRRFLPSHHPTHPPPPPRCRSSGSGGFLHYGHGRSLANALSVVVWSSFCSSWPPSLFSSAASCGAVFHKNQHTARRIWGEIFWGAEGQQHAEAEQFELTSYRAHQFCLRIFWLLI